jgi:hypothetical protein
MQLNSIKAGNIKGQLTLATCSLLQVTATATQAADSEWDINAATVLVPLSQPFMQEEILVMKVNALTSDW